MTGNCVRPDRERDRDRRGVACVYRSQFWALYFLQDVQKVDVLASSLIVGTACSLPLRLWCSSGWLSDKVGRRPIILPACCVASLSYYPLYRALGTFAVPGAINYPLAICRGGAGVVVGHGLRADRRVLAE